MTDVVYLLKAWMKESEEDHKRKGYGMRKKWRAEKRLQRNYKGEIKQSSRKN